MKKWIYILFTLAFAACADKQLYISGHLSNLPDQNACLKSYDSEGVVRIFDKSFASNGEFKLDLPDILPDMIYLTFDATDGLFIPIIVNGNSITVSGDMTNPEEIKVEGSKENTLLAQYRESVKPLEISLRAITELHHEVEYKNETDSIKNIIFDIRRKFIADNPSNIVSAYLATTMLSDSTAREEAAYFIGSLDREMPDNVFLRRLKRAVR